MKVSLSFFFPKVEPILLLASKFKTILYRYIISFEDPGEHHWYELLFGGALFLNHPFTFNVVISHIKVQEEHQMAFYVSLH